MKANSNISFAALLLAVLTVSFLISTTTEAAADLKPAGGKGYCGQKCGERCAKAGVLDRCIKYCGICCEKCKCVPSGTYGNKHECPCYRDQRSSKGTPKCP